LLLKNNFTYIKILTNLFNIKKIKFKRKHEDTTNVEIRGSNLEYV